MTNRQCGRNGCIIQRKSGLGNSHSKPTEEEVLCSGKNHGERRPEKKEHKMKKWEENS
jgi:hypothetical protein